MRIMVLQETHLDCSLVDVYVDFCIFMKTCIFFRCERNLITEFVRFSKIYIKHNINRDHVTAFTHVLRARELNVCGICGRSYKYSKERGELLRQVL